MPSLFIVIVVDIDVNNTKVFSVAMEMQHCIPFAFLSSYKIFLTADNNNTHPTLCVSVSVVFLTYPAGKLHLLWSALYCHLAALIIPR
jgi:hypothetical protein